MAKIWTCRCGAVNDGTRTCDACNEPRRRGSEPAAETPGAWHRLCQWTAQGGACRMRPEIWESRSRQFCLWHYTVNRDPRLGHDREAFDRYLAELRGRRYCSLWVHHSAEYLWTCVRGTEPADETPGPCEQAGCSLRPDLIPAGFSALQAAAKVQRDLALAAHRREQDVDDQF